MAGTPTVNAENNVINRTVSVNALATIVSYPPDSVSIGLGDEFFFSFSLFGISNFNRFLGPPDVILGAIAPGSLGIQLLRPVLSDGFNVRCIGVPGAPRQNQVIFNVTVTGRYE